MPTKYLLLFLLSKVLSLKVSNSAHHAVSVGSVELDSNNSVRELNISTLLQFSQAPWMSMNIEGIEVPVVEQDMGHPVFHAVAAYHPHTAAWKRGDGVNLFEKKSQLVSSLLPWREKLVEFENKIKIWSSIVEQPDGAIHVQRFGPFVSTGGFDWWTVDYEDACFLSAALKREKDGIALVEGNQNAVDRNGNPIAYPPLFNHHTYLRPGHTSMSNWRCIVLHDADFCTMQISDFLFVSDGTCEGERTNAECSDLVFPEGFGKIRKKPSNLNNIWNDVRSSGSEPLEWYLEIMIRWKPPAKLRGLHLINLLFPGVNNHPNAALEGEIPVPLDQESFIWCTGQFQSSGRVLKVTHHTHGIGFDQNFLFTGTPEDIGFHFSYFQAKGGNWNPIFPEDVGMLSNTKLKDYIFANLNYTLQNKEAHRTYTPSLRLVSEGRVKFTTHGHMYALKQHFSEYLPWNLTKLQPWVMVSFFKPVPDYHVEYSTKVKTNWQHSIAHVFIDDDTTGYSDSDGAHIGSWDTNKFYGYLGSTGGLDNRSFQLQSLLRQLCISALGLPMSETDNIFNSWYLLITSLIEQSVSKIVFFTVLFLCATGMITQWRAASKCNTLCN